jgi:glutamate dehydrogenase
VATRREDRVADAVDRIMAALAQARHDRPDLLAELARVTLRRVPDTLLLAADPVAVARRVALAFDAIDRRHDQAFQIEILRPDTGLDGRPTIGAVVQVASEDRPFLLSTVVDELERSGLRVVRSLHPIIGADRAADGRISAIVPARTAERRESLLHLEVEGTLDPGDEPALIARLRRLLVDVAAATDDHEAMRGRITSIAKEMRAGTWGTDADDADEVAALLEWLLDDNLVLLGIREYEATELDGRPAVRVQPGSGLGLLADASRSRYLAAIPLDELPLHLQERIDHAPLLIVTRTSRLSTVQRRARMEYFGLTRRSASGRFASEIRILGLFTRKGLSEPARSTPVLRRKLAAILEREDVVDGSHDAVTLTSLFQALPKDELFQASVDDLHHTLVGLLHAEEHREIRVLVRPDPATRTVSVLVAVPRDHYSPRLRERIQGLLKERFTTRRIDADVSLGDRMEALVRFLLHLDSHIPDVAVLELQNEIRRLARSWDDTLLHDLRPRIGDSEANRLTGGVARRLPQTYRELVTPERAVSDLLLLDQLSEDGDHLLVALLPDGDRDTARLRAAKLGAALELSAFLPILESIGLTVVEEVPFALSGDPTLHLHDFGVRARGLDVDRDGPRIADGVLAAWRGHLEVDALNRLVLAAGLDWRDVAILRAYRRLRRQLGTAYTPEYVNDTLVGHPQIARTLVDHIHARFDPARAAAPAAQEAAREAVVAACNRLERLDHDRILRGFLRLIDATVRTNAFRSDAVADATGTPYLALKLDPARVPDVPAPRPHREIFVHSPEVEGVHLRAGPVARGGLRWSDRRDDVRAEVLDLVKAQVLKNALIVPTGAKGGFVVRREPADPRDLRDEVRRQYVTFVRGLLDVTDDLEGDTVVPPPGVLRHDGDDPYLVVAADRGTATYSDVANGLAARYGFWLDDAFASGGSNGYDHKALGVTARGAWVAVQRHFRELGIDVQSEPTTVVGIGDMSGDVFGNGLLRSRAVLLVAAFDHRDIFLDPDPDPEVAFEERQRLFELPRSSWQDYDPDKLSPGGMVVPRSARSVELSEAVRARLRIDESELSPPELIRAILRAPVDLLFAGGIGTYVKASTERNSDVGDKANNELRIDADELRARVVGEGANLALTQRARIEYARRGGHVNQDAIDNAAGVSTSDHEVNLKILLTLAQEEGRLDREERDELLASLADDVVALVLREVDLQAAAVSRAVRRSAGSIDTYVTLLHHLEDRHELDRTVEVLPSDAELAQRADAGAGLTRPELATLLAWAKRDLKEALLASDVPDSPLLGGALATYFPRELVERFADLLPRHRLRRELVATITANEVVDRLGLTFAADLSVEFKVPLTQVVLAYRVARDVLSADHWWELIEAHEATHPPERISELEGPLLELLTTVTSTLLTEPSAEGYLALRDRDASVASTLTHRLLQLGTADQRRARIAHARWLVDDLVDPELARLVACARDLAMIPDIAGVLERSDGTRDAETVAEVFLRLGDGLGIDRLEDGLGRTTVATPWARRQRTGLRTDLRRLRRDAARLALDGPSEDAPAIVERFLAPRADPVARARAVGAEADRVDVDRLDAIAVAARAVRDAVDRPAAQTDASGFQG